MAGLANTCMETHWWGLPPQSTYSDDDRKCRVQDRSGGNGLYARAEADDFHVRGQRSTKLGRVPTNSEWSANVRFGAHSGPDSSRTLPHFRNVPITEVTGRKVKS